MQPEGLKRMDPKNGSMAKRDGFVLGTRKPMDEARRLKTMDPKGSMAKRMDFGK
jgi:hypothetical protein